MEREAGRNTFRLGVWLDYGRTLTPSEGIGVFVHNLAAGLLELDAPLELVLLTHPQEQHVVERLRLRAPDRVTVLPDARQKHHSLPRLNSLLERWTVARRGVVRFEKRIQDRSRDQLVLWQSRLRTFARAGFHRGRFAFLAAGLLLGLVMMLLWPMAAACVLLLAALQALMLPLRVLDWIAEQAYGHPRLSGWAVSTKLARAAECDLWIIPYVGHEYFLDFPAVIFVHDLVIAHHPEHFNPHFVARLNGIVRERVQEAIFGCCMSEFIRTNDLLGVLKLPRERTRMVPPAAPSDFPVISADAAVRLLPQELCKPFLLYPAAFRGYKNHRMLIEALRHLRQQLHETNLQLVFTGAATPFPSELAALARAYGLQAHVHVLGRVSRETLAALYQHAVATIVPSLYEQGSFPIYEALHWNCPVACSDIPALREQCASLGDAMIYFDPRDPVSIARAIVRLRESREAIRDEQSRRAQAGEARTWKQVAREWLPIFEEAAELARSRRMSAAA